MIRGIREIRGYDQPVSSSPSSRTSSSAGSTAARPAAAAPSRLRGGLPEGDRPSRTSGLGGLHKQWCNTGRSGHGSLPVRPVQRARLSAATVQHGQVELNRAASCRMFARYAIATAGCVFPRPGCPLGIRQCSIGHSFSASANRGERRKPAARDGRAVAVAVAGAARRPGPGLRAAPERPLPTAGRVAAARRAKSARHDVPQEWRSVDRPTRSIPLDPVQASARFNTDRSS